MPVEVTLEGRALTEAPLRVPARSGYVLPLGLDVGGVRLVGGTGEVAGVEEGAIRFRPLLGAGEGPGYVDLAPGTRVQPDEDYVVAAGPDGCPRGTPVDPAGSLVIRLG